MANNLSKRKVPFLNNVISAICPEGWEGKPDFSRCYYLLTVGGNWSEANVACMGLDTGATLTSIHSGDENDYIVSILGGNSVWIGGTDGAEEGIWRCVKLNL